MFAQGSFLTPWQHLVQWHDFALVTAQSASYPRIPSTLTPSHYLLFPGHGMFCMLSLCSVVFCISSILMIFLFLRNSYSSLGLRSASIFSVSSPLTARLYIYFSLITSMVFLFKLVKFIHSFTHPFIQYWLPIIDWVFELGCQQWKNIWCPWLYRLPF